MEGGAAFFFHVRQLLIELFAGAFAGTVFDWRTDRVEGVSVERDRGAAEGTWALRLNFDQSRNVRYAHVSQRAVVQAGAWRFEARMRTEDITTDEGLGFRIYDAEAPQRLDVRTGRLTGTHGWTRLGARLAVGSATRVLCVQVVREPSLKFDNKLGGTAWIDALTLRRESR